MDEPSLGDQDHPDEKAHRGIKRIEEKEQSDDEDDQPDDIGIGEILPDCFLVKFKEILHFILYIQVHGILHRIM